MRDEAEILIAGAGIVGLALARELVRAGFGGILLLEKEPEVGLHASGRNSGVLHAGIYYAPGTLRAASCLAGNLRMREYCRKRGLPLRETGKVVVARDEGEIPVLEELFRRATANGARVEWLDERELAGVEPDARTVGKALWSRDTAVVDPKAVVARLARDLADSGRAEIRTGCPFLGLQGSSTAVTGRGEVRFRRFVNCAGAWCDRVAHAFGVGRRYRIVPFKGLYRKLRAGAPPRVHGNIYPVPDIRNPFLGIHFTRSVAGEVYLGPTAIPAFGRENYGILSGAGREAVPIVLRDAALFLRNPQFRSIALTEPRKYSKQYFLRDAARLVRTLDPRDVERSGKVGIRPQLVDRTRGELVMDFLVESSGDSLHVLNPISPAFTASMDLARRLVEEHFRR